jgi:competence protein ComEA
VDATTPSSSAPAVVPGPEHRLTLVPTSNGVMAPPGAYRTTPSSSAPAELPGPRAPADTGADLQRCDDSLGAYRSELVKSNTHLAAVSAWPRSAQLAMVFLLGVATTLLAVHGCRGLRWGSRPTELERNALSAHRIDLNRADYPELLQVPGVGNSLAQRIREHGPFQSVDDLTQVKGIGPATLERLRPWVTVQSPYSPAPGQIGKPPASGDGPKVAGKKQIPPGERISINRASAAELQRLPGIGPKRAQQIIEERQKRPFTDIEELRRVSGIGPTTMDKLRPYITVEDLPLRMMTAGGS